MIFQHTLQQVLSGQKTQTRRVIGAKDSAVYDDNGDIQAVKTGNRTKWAVGKTYAVQPARTAAQVARIRLLKIRRETVSAISQADAIAEGYDSIAAFIAGWQRIHGQNSLEQVIWVLEFALIETDDD